MRRWVEAKLSRPRDTPQRQVILAGVPGVYDTHYMRLLLRASPFSAVTADIKHVSDSIVAAQVCTRVQNNLISDLT